MQANHGFFCRRLSAHEISQLSEVCADLEAGGALVAAGRADQTGGGVLEATFAEHETIITALLQGDRPAAAAALRQHITLSHDEALEAVRIGLERLYSAE